MGGSFHGGILSWDEKISMKGAQDFLILFKTKQKQ